MSRILLQAMLLKLQAGNLAIGCNNLQWDAITRGSEAGTIGLVTMVEPVPKLLKRAYRRSPMLPPRFDNYIVYCGLDIIR